MLYRIFYSANKERRKTEEQRLEKFGSAVIPIGTIGCYFVDFDIAEEIAEELKMERSNMAHIMSNTLKEIKYELETRRIKNIQKIVIN